MFFSSFSTSFSDYKAKRKEVQIMRGLLLGEGYRSHKFEIGIYICRIELVATLRFRPSCRISKLIKGTCGNTYSYYLKRDYYFGKKYCIFRDVLSL
jgi:hypothetical protein